MTQVWIILAPSLLAFMCALALYPYGATRAALHAARQRDGSLCGPRVITEIRWTNRLVGHVLLLPLILLGCAQLAIVLIVELIEPGSYLVALYRGYHPEIALHAADPEQMLSWIGSLETGEGRRLQDALLQHWPLWPAYLIVSVLFVAFWTIRRAPRHIRRYVRAARRRQQRLAHLQAAMSTRKRNNR